MMRDHENNGCLSRSGKVKKRWATEAAARFVADWDAMQDGGEHDIYHCPTCGYWHTTCRAVLVAYPPL